MERSLKRFDRMPPPFGVLALLGVFLLMVGLAVLFDAGDGMR